MFHDKLTELRRALGRGAGRRIAPQYRRRLLLESLEDRHMLAANLTVTDAFLRDGVGFRDNTPVLGEQIEVQVNFRTTDLFPQSAYRIEVAVDGVTLSSGTIRSGAGIASGTFFERISGWYAEPGEHTVDVFIDAGRNVAEQNEQDNTFSFKFTPERATTLPSTFIWPETDTPFQDQVFRNYVDLDPTSVVRDWAGETGSVNGKIGLDFGAPNFAAMDAGRAVVAVADGVVVAVSEGSPDRNTAGSGLPANLVTLDHGNGWQTSYLHLRRDSVRVKLGDSVQQGDMLGLEGSSGDSTASHLQFIVRHNGRPVETFLDPNTFWESPPGYVGDEPFLVDAGTTNYNPVRHLGERPSNVDVISQAAGQTSYAWGVFSGLRQGDFLEVTWIRPSGAIHARRTVTLAQSSTTSTLSFQANLPTTPDLGTWTVDIRNNQRLLGREHFEVTASGAPEIRIDDRFGDILLDERYSPVNFGTVAQKTTPPSITFTVVNHGTNTLVLNGITVPRGFLITDGLGAAIAPGGQETFTVTLNTSDAGYYAGQIRVFSNDADEATYNISIEGTVTSLAIQRLTLGIGQRTIAESGSTIANVTRGGDLSLGLMVNLANSLPRQATIPSSVMIPAGQASATFTIGGINDGLEDGVQVVRFTASAANFADASNTLNVVDVPTIVVDIEADQISEADGTSAANVRIARLGGDLTQRVEFMLALNDLTEAAVPQLVTMEPFQSIATISLDAVDDDILDGPRTVILTVTADGYEDGVDSVVVLDHETVGIALESQTIAEDGGTLSGTITRSNTDNQNPLVVQLRSSDPTEATVVTQVTIPAGQASIPITVAAVDDDLLDGDQRVMITSSAPAYVNSSAEILVTDAEDLRLQIANFSISENGGITTGTLTRSNSNIGSPLRVSLSSNDTSEATVPPFIDIPANQKSVQFPIVAVDDNLLDGNQAIVVTATAAGYRSGFDSLVVVDHETLTIALAQTTIFEDGGMTIGTVTRNNSDLGLPQSVVLSSSNSNEAVVPLSIQIPANQASANFVVSSVDDGIVDGDKGVNITASAGGYVSAATSLTVSEQPGLSLVSATPRLAENAAPTTMTVRRHNTSKSAQLTVTLNNNDPSQASVPASVVIPANASSVTFPFTPIDDTLLDGTHAVMVTASATGLASSTATVNVEDHETLTLSLAAATISENGPGTLATVTRSNMDNGAPLTVTIQGSDPTEATTLPSVIIPANQSSFTFPITAVDDMLLDGPQSVTFTASAAGYQSATANLGVLDHERLTVKLASSSISEKDGSVTGTVTRSNTDLALPIIVQLSSGDPTEATVVSFVQILAQQSSATFTISSVDDDILDGTQIVAIRAQSAGYVEGSADLQVTDYEALSVTLNDASISEANGSTSGMVTRGNADIGSPLTVQLRSSDTTEAVVVGTVVIAANDVSAPFDVTAVNDSIFDGDQLVTISASASGYVTGNALLTVTDREDLTLQLDASSMSERQGFVTGTVSRSNTNLLFPTTVTVATDLPGRTSVAQTVIIKAGKLTSAPFRISAIDNHLLDGPANATISVAAVGYSGDTKVVTVLDDETLTIALQNSQISENGGQTTATVRRNNVDINQPLTVTLAGDDPSEALIPASVTIPAGLAASAPFTIFALDDNVFDGDQTVTITATAAGYVTSTTTLRVTDLETLTVSIDAAEISELNGQATGTVTRLNTDIGQPLLVNLIGSDDTEARVPATVLIPANAKSTTFPITAQDDSLLDGTQTFMVTVKATGYADASASLGVTDFETLSATLSQSSMSEKDGRATLRVMRNNTNIGQALAVTVTGGDPTEVTFAGNLVIPANATSTTVNINAVDDATLDGSQTLTLIAAAAGYVPASATLNVTDHETLELSLGDTAVSELNGSTIATITRNNIDDDAALTVMLTSLGELPDGAADPNPPFVPATFTIPAGAFSASFTVEARDDDLLTGQRVATITASAAGFVAAAAPLGIDDVETLSVALDTQPLREGTTTSATVTRNNTNHDAAIVVSLVSSEPSRLDVPAAVTIPAGAASATFALTSVDDGLITGNQTLTVELSSAGYEPGILQVEIEDVTFGWQNPLGATDVNNDGRLTPSDVLVLVNDLNARGARQLPTTGPLKPPPYLDVNGDGFITANDVVVTINAINNAVGGEGESAAPLPVSDSARGQGRPFVEFHRDPPQGPLKASLAQATMRRISASPASVVATAALQTAGLQTRPASLQSETDSEVIESLLDLFAEDVAAQLDVHG